MTTTLDGIWRAVGLHLWQTTLFLVPLMLLALVLRRTSGRLAGVAWGAAFVKVLVPLGLAAAAARANVPQAGLTLAPPRFVQVVDVLVGGSDSPRAGGHAGLALAAGAVWLAGVALLLARGIAAARAAPRDEPACDPDAELALDAALRGSGIARKHVVLSGCRTTPHVRGVARPRIVVAESLARGLAPADLRALLLHEEAHRLRREPLREAVRRGALIALFFYPPLWLIVRKLRDAAEIACDESATSRGAEAAGLARALAFCVSQGLSPGPLAAHAARSRRSLLSERFHRLDNPGRYKPMRAHRIVASASVVLVAAALAWPLSSATRGLRPTSIVVPAVGVVSAPADAGREVSVRVTARVDSDGHVVEAFAGDAAGALPAGSGAAFVDAAREAVSRATFTPGAAGKADVEIAWELPEGGPVGFGAARIEPGGTLTRAVVASPLSITEGISPPRKIEDAQPEFPPEARVIGVTGDVVLQTVIGADGTVGSVAVLREIEGQPLLTSSAVEAVKKWKYAPALRDGEPVAVSLVVRVRFDLK